MTIELTNEQQIQLTKNLLIENLKEGGKLKKFKDDFETKLGGKITVTVDATEFASIIKKEQQKTWALLPYRLLVGE